MTKRAELKKHVHTLEEISNIMSAMKNLALIEINKISKYIPTQDRVMQTINEVGTDFLSSYPEYFTDIQLVEPSIYLLIGSERGLCGRFNENILQKIDAIKSETKFIVIGQKLSAKMQGDVRVIQTIDGCSAAEEIPEVIAKLLEFLTQSNFHPGRWAMIHNLENHSKTETLLLRPFAEFIQTAASINAFPVMLYQTKEEFLAGFIHQYLFFLFYYILYQSFMAENHQRLNHLETALNQLEKQKMALQHHLNLLRQEEITEEIQIIMLSAAAIIESLK